MGLSLESNSVPFSAEGLKSTKQTRMQQLCEDNDAGKCTPPPEGYTTNSDKEVLSLEYIDGFRSQFEKLFPTRRRLFLTAPNEYGVEKFVCTTLRPTLLPNRELYDLERCAEFVSNFLHFEPLERPTEPPSYLPSPDRVLEWATGDSFDFAMLLCSFLLGAGYDAYVVYGTAPKWITARDRSRTQCPYIASTMPPKVGEEDHENGIGIPPYAASGTKIDDREALFSASSKPESRGGQSEVSVGGVGGVNDAQAKSRHGGGAADPAAGGVAPPEASANATAGGGDKDNVDKNGPNIGEHAGGSTGRGGGEGADPGAKGGLDPGGEEEDGVCKERAEEKYTQPYKVQPRGAPESVFLAEAARREEEERKAAMVDPWQSDGEEKDKAEAAQGEEEDPHRLERMHAWVLVRGGKRGTPCVSYVEPTTGAVCATSEGPYLTVEGIFNDKNYWVNMQQQQQQQQRTGQLEEQKQQIEREKIDQGHLAAVVNAGVAGEKSAQAATATRTSSLSFDLLDGSLWEYVFIDPMFEEVESAGAVDENDDLGLLSGAEGDAGPKGGATERGGPGVGSQKESILDVPRSWVRKLSLDRDLVALRYPPRGRRTVMYHRAKAELFAENSHDEATTLRLTLYKDRRCTIVKEIREVFVNRADRLYSRVRYPLEGRVSELFRPGRPNALRNVVTWSGRRRELYFFVEARLDGLVSRFEDVGKKVLHIMQGRSDRLTYRSVNVMSPEEAAAKGLPSPYTLPGTNGESDLVVYKMTEKFARNDAVPAELDVAKRTYYLAEGRIRTLYHYPDSDVTRASKMHVKDNRASSGGAAFAYEVSGGSGIKKLGCGDASRVGGVEAAGGGGVDRGVGGEGGVGGREAEESLQDAIMAEKDCFTAAKHAHAEMAYLIKLRNQQEEEVILERPVFETARERRAEQEKMAEQMKHEEEDVDQQQVDYLTPFLQHVLDVRNISSPDAQRVRDACLKALKERLLERANIINSRLNDETSALAKKQAAFQRTQRENDANAEEEFEIFCSEAIFRIKVLEQRLVQHEESALKKYADLDAKLASDPRLQALHART